VRLLLDENASRSRTLRALAAAGHDVETVVRSLGVGTGDAAIATYAIHTDRILVTQDQDDFRVLYAAYEDHPGLIVIYPTLREPSVAQIVSAINNIAAIYQDLAGAVISLNEFFW